MAPVNVVIVGGSFAGLNIAHSLLKDVPNVKIVLINPSRSWYFPIAAPRILAKPSAFRSEQYLIPIKDILAKYPSDKVEFIAGTATAIDATAKTVSVTETGSENAKSLSYDYLVIASGSTTPATTGKITGTPMPFKQTNRDDMKQLIESSQQLVQDAKEIVIAGAGPIGVELAGELAEAAMHNGKAGQVSITLVSATDRVLPTLKAGGSAAAKQLLEQMKIKLITSRRVTGVEEATPSDGTKQSWTISLDNGDKLSADLYIPTTGVLPNSSFVPAQFLDKDGWVKVDKELRVQGDDGKASLPIYAAGDITNNWQRLAFKAGAQAAVAAANIKADILGKGGRKIYDQGEAVMMVVPVGEAGGTGQVFGIRPWSFMVRMIKGKDFLVSKALSAVAGK
jgi:NADH dehydrogenase FAD-containing subunit